MDLLTKPSTTGSAFKNGFKLFNGNHSLQNNLLKPYLSSFKIFKKSWDYLEFDSYLLDEGAYRLRRYSVFHLDQNQLHKLPTEPHLQQLFYNPLHGDIYRHYKDLSVTTYRNECFQVIIEWVSNLIESDLKGWRIQAHQFRVTAKGKERGKPSPEGIHKDGADFVLIMLIGRSNVCGGESSLYNNQRELIQQFTLLTPGDCILIDDKAVYHNTASIKTEDYRIDANRDTLVLTFHKPAS